MEFSGRDLEDIQRVAGLLGLTVDELIQIRRRQPSSPTPGATSSYTAPVKTPPPDSGPLQAVQQQQRSSDDDMPHDWHTPFQDPPAVPDAAHRFDTTDLAGRSPETDGLAGGDVSTVVEQTGDTEVILLNPQPAWYDCNAGLGDLAHEILLAGLSSIDVDVDSLPGMNDDDVDSYVQVMEVDSVSTPLEREDESMTDAATDWTLVSSSPSSRRQRYERIASKPGRASLLRSSTSSTSRIRKKRSTYQPSMKRETNLTRQLNACVRCKMQRNRCIPDPLNPTGPCMPCQMKTARMSRLPCLRYRITESLLFRTSLDYMPFYSAHPMIGPCYGDFHIDKLWTSAPARTIRLGQIQIGIVNFRIELHKFVPPLNTADVDLKGRSMYLSPWAIRDPDAVVDTINTFIDKTTGDYMNAFLDDSDSIVWDVFRMARRASVFPVPNSILRKTIRLWVVCRFLESGWRCWDDDVIEATNPKDPYHEWSSLPPYLDYQVASIFIHRILSPLRSDVLRELQTLMEGHRAKDWYVIFLTSFILLHNYELQMRFQQEFAERRQAPVRYLDMPLVRETNSGAKTILAHFHYCCNGQKPFAASFDWASQKLKRMAHLDSEQTEFMMLYRDRILKKSETFQKVNHTHAYDERYWYTSQLFDPDWKPRDTLEYSPPPKPKMAHVTLTAAGLVRPLSAPAGRLAQ